jgi:hypothetical protein
MKIMTERSQLRLALATPLSFSFVAEGPEALRPRLAAGLHNVN